MTEETQTETPKEETKPVEKPKRKTRKKAEPKPEPKPEAATDTVGGLVVTQLENGRTRIVYPNGITIEK